MPIQINDINVVDDDRNVSAAGIVTVGTGNSATIIDGTTGITSVGIGITMEGVSGNISIAGTLTAAGFNIPTSIVSFNPTNGATNVVVTSSITITFNQAVGVATTGTILLKSGSTGGSTIKTIGVSDIRSIPNGVIINTNTYLPASTAIYPIIPSGFIKSTSGDFVGLNTTGADSYSFTTKSLALGDPYEGGFLICQSGGTRWVVASSSTEVSRTWYCRNDAITTAQSTSGFTGWFIPSSSQAGNPGQVCRTYWDSYQPSYWTDTAPSPTCATVQEMNFGFTPLSLKTNTYSVRAFRCVAY